MGEWLGEEEHIERLLTAKKVTLHTPMIVMIKYTLLALVNLCRSKPECST